MEIYFLYGGLNVMTREYRLSRRESEGEGILWWLRYRRSCLSGFSRLFLIICIPTQLRSNLSSI